MQKKLKNAKNARNAKAAEKVEDPDALKNSKDSEMRKIEN